MTRPTKVKINLLDEHRAKKRAQQRAWYAADPNRRRKHKLKARYGLTLEDYEVMFKRQSGSCRICAYKPSSKEKHLVIDHSHKTNKVRGLLCQWCNTGLGHFRDSPKLLRLAALYLTKALRSSKIKRHTPRKVK